MLQKQSRIYIYICYLVVNKMNTGGGKGVLGRE